MAQRLDLSALGKPEGLNPSDLDELVGETGGTVELYTGDPPADPKSTKPENFIASFSIPPSIILSPRGDK